MQETLQALLEKIIEEEVSGQEKDNGAPIAIVRKRIALAIAREVIGPEQPEDRYWNIFAGATEAEYELWAFLVLAQLEGVRELRLTMDQIEQLERLYEQWQRMCEFLMDEYGRLPERFKDKWAFDNLLEIAGYVAAAKETMVSDFGEHMETMLALNHFPIIKEMIGWTRFAALGEDQYTRFAAEMNAAMQTLRQNPHFAPREI